AIPPAPALTSTSTVFTDYGATNGWLETFNGTDSSGDSGQRIAVDSSGNIYSAGKTNQGGHFNWMVRKISSSGGFVWRTFYNAPSNLAATANGIAVDGAGNVYVAGFETRSDLSQGDNIVVKKYDPNGLTVWTSTFNGVSNLDDEANDV